jgi:hypothetical protein
MIILITFIEEQPGGLAVNWHGYNPVLHSATDLEKGAMQVVESTLERLKQTVPLLTGEPGSVSIIRTVKDQPK